MAERSSPKAIRALAWAVAAGVVLWIGVISLTALVAGGAGVFPTLLQRATSDSTPGWILVAQIVGLTGFDLAFGALAVLGAWYLRRAIVAGAPKPFR